MAEAVALFWEYLNSNFGLTAVPPPALCLKPILAVTVDEAETAIGILNIPSSNIEKPGWLDETEPVIEPNIEPNLSDDDDD